MRAPARAVSTAPLHRLLPAGAAALALAAVGAIWAWRLLGAYTGNFDEGVYLVTAREMLHGALPFRDVFSSQPPLFPWLLWAALRVGGDGVAAARWLFILSGLAVCGATAALAHRAAGAWWAGAAAALACGLAAPLTGVSGSCEAEAPALALAAGALVLVARRGRAARPAWAAAAGALFGLGLCVKLLVAPMAVPLLWWLPGARARAVALGGALAAGLAVVLPSDPLRVWDQAIGFHLTALTADLPAFFGPAQLARELGVLAAAGLAGAAALARVPRLRSGLALWAAACAAFLLAHRPVFTHHLALLVPPLAIAAGAGLAALPRALGRAALPSWLGGAAAGAGLLLVLAAGVAAGPLPTARSATPEERAAIGLIAARTGPDDRVASDEPMLVYLAGRRAPAELVDVSAVRIRSGSLRPEAALRAAAGARLVVSWTGRLAGIPGFPGWLAGCCERLAPGPGPDRGIFQVRAPPPGG